MKILLFIFFLLNLLELKEKYLRTCKTSILRSMGFHSRISPNKMNSLCPRITLNCCTYHDQLLMHKLWISQQREDLTYHYIEMRRAFGQINQVISNKQNILLVDFTKDFVKNAKPEPSKFLVNHLAKISSEFMIENDSFYKNLFKILKKTGLKKFYKEVMKMRESVLCMICDWHNHNFINSESLTISYSVQFCHKMIQNFLPTIYDKYNKIFGMLLILDEWVFLVSGRRLFNSHNDRALFRRYILITARCRKNRGKIEECADFCKQFNVNRFSYMFDGEKKPLREFSINFRNFLDDYESDPIKVYAERTKRWNYDNLKHFQDNFSILSTKITKDPSENTDELNTFKLKFHSENSKKFFNDPTPSSPIQIEKIDDKRDNLLLFRQNDDPIDISNYIITFQQGYGINLIEEGKHTNLNLSKEKIISLIENKKSSEKALNEYILDPVKDTLKTINVTNVQNWFTDAKLRFKRYSAKFDEKAANNVNKMRMGKSYIGLMNITFFSIIFFFIK